MDERGMGKKIDLIDYQILNLLRERIELGVRLKRSRGDIAGAAREEEMLGKLTKCARGMVRPEFAEALFRAVIEEDKYVQGQDLRLVGFQGEHGAFSEEASYAYNPALIPIPYKDFGEIFQEVATGAIDCAIVPVENSLGGTVTPVMDLLIESDLFVVGEITIPIHHCLLVLPDTDYRDLKVAYSHSRALAQCKDFISRHRIEPRPYYDTAGSAKMLSEVRPESSGAIASRLCAELYHLEVLNENIEDYHSNSTRFNIIARKAAEETGDKCSIAFSVNDETGGLLKALTVFSDAAISLGRIDSRPIKEEPGKYIFTLDFAGSDKDEKVVAALKKIEENTLTYKFLGCYRKR